MSSDITLRLEKGTDLTYAEADENFTHIRRLYRFTEDAVTTGGSGSAYTITSLNTPQTSFVPNMIFGFVASFTNDADSPTLVIDGLDPREIKRGNGNTVYAGEIQANSFYQVRYNALDNSYWILENPTSVEPAGKISMWSGLSTEVPPGYALCDGSNGTPDLTDKFIVGAGDSFSVGDTGGSVSKTTQAGGNHDHGGDTQGHSLTIAEMPSHDHGIGGVSLLRGTKNEISGTGPDYDPPDPDGNYITPTSQGDGDPHSHGISDSGTHTHGISDIRPPYYALAFIMKL